MQDIMTAPDNKETTAGFLGLFNIDDESLFSLIFLFF